MRKLYEFLKKEKVTHFCKHCGSLWAKDGNTLRHLVSHGDCYFCELGTYIHEIDFDVSINNIMIIDDDY